MGLASIAEISYRGQSPSSLYLQEHRSFLFCGRITVQEGMKSNGFAQCKQRVQVTQVFSAEADPTVIAD